MAHLKAPLLFLRPLGLPRPSTITCFFNARHSLTTISTPESSSKKVEDLSDIPLIHYYKSKPTQPSTSEPLSKKVEELSDIPLVRHVRPFEPPRVSPETYVTSPILPYRIGRTKGQRLPVYLDRKRGGNLLLTKIRKAEGNLEALVQDLHKALNLGEEERKMKNRMERKAKNRVYEAPEPLIWINPLTKHIVIRVSPFFSPVLFYLRCRDHGWILPQSGEQLALLFRANYSRPGAP